MRDDFLEIIFIKFVSMILLGMKMPKWRSSRNIDAARKSVSCLIEMNKYMNKCENVDDKWILRFS